MKGVGRYSIVNTKEIDVCENDEVRNSVLLETGLTTYKIKLADAKELTDLPVSAAPVPIGSPPLAQPFRDRVFKLIPSRGALITGRE